MKKIPVNQESYSGHMTSLVCIGLPSIIGSQKLELELSISYVFKSQSPTVPDTVALSFSFSPAVGWLLPLLFKLHREDLVLSCGEWDILYIYYTYLWRNEDLKKLTCQAEFTNMCFFFKINHYALVSQANWCNMTFTADNLFPSHSCTGWPESRSHQDLNMGPQIERRMTYHLSYPSPLIYNLNPTNSSHN